MVRKIASAILVLVSIFSVETNAQCIVINELLINGASSFDGQSAPNTEEWIELYNTCSEPIDISCWALADDDFVIRFPAGTVIQPNDFFVVGSVNSSVTVDLFPATCNCASPLTATIIFTNGGEQLVLIDDTGVIQDGVIWGGGQNVPFNINDSNGGCGNISTNVTNASAQFEQLPLVSGSSGEGCTYARACDGSPIWEIRCGADISAHAPNGDVVIVDIDASASNICTDQCIDFSDLSIGDVNGWTWTFEGAATPNSALENPTSICYNTAGVFDVTLTVTTDCGTFSQIFTNFITVSNTVPFTISANGPTTFCEDESVTLNTSVPGVYQWYQGTSPINGASGASFTPTVSGDYYAASGTGACQSTSNTISIVINPLPIAIISNPASLGACEGEVITLTANTGTGVQWYLNDIAIPGATSISFDATLSGDYSIEVTSNNCSTTSSLITILFSPVPSVVLSPAGPINLCPGNEITLTATGNYDDFTWLKDDVPFANNTSSATINTAGEYQILVSNGDNCEVLSNIVVVTILNVDALTISADNNITSICPTATTTLTASANFFSYSWEMNTNPIGSNSNVLENAAVGNYTVEATDANNCVVTYGISITSATVPNATILPNGDVITCEDTFTLTASGGVNYQWLQDNLPIVGATGTTFQANTDGAYSVRAINAAGCEGTSIPTNVDFREGIEPEIIGPISPVCEGNEATLSLNVNYSSVEWSTGETTQTLEITSSGNYFVNVIDENGCEGQDDFDFTFVSLPNVNAGQDVNSDCSNGAFLEVTGDGNLSWQPSPFLKTITETYVQANPTQTTTFTAQAEQNGCFATDDVTVTVECTFLYVPNSITPNGDGVNDVLQIIGTGIGDFHISIFDRWGDVVYESNDINQAWTGGKNDYYVQDGVYSFVITAYDLEGLPITENIQIYGSVLVLR